MSKKSNNEVLLGAFIVVAGGLLAYMSLAVGGLSMTPGVHVTARFTNASGLVKDAMVAVAGVQVGHIEALEVDHDTAVIHLFINRSANIRKDVHAMVRAKSLLGEKYLELEPQSRDAAMLADGDQITFTRPAVEVDEVLAAIGPVLKKVDPQDIANVIHEAAVALHDNKDHLASIIQHADSTMTQVDGLVKKNGEHVSQAASHLASLSANGDALLKNKRGEIERTVSHVDHVAAVVDREAPGLLAKGNRIATNVDSIAANVRRDTPHLLTDAKRTLKHADATLVKLPGTIDKVNPLLDKANNIKRSQIEEFAHDTLVKTGIKIFLTPFGPNEDDWSKTHPVPTPTPSH